jgi:hypothetical protein
MAHLTLQEVIDRINHIYFSVSSVENHRTRGDQAYYRTSDPQHRPEFYIPRITKRLARFIFNTSPVQLRGRV